MENDIVFQEDRLTIKYHFPKEQMPYYEYEDFLDWLGDNDIVTANELNDDLICASGDLYWLTDFGMDELHTCGEVVLKKVACLDDYVDMNKENERDFYKWYYELDR